MQAINDKIDQAAAVQQAVQQAALQKAAQQQASPVARARSAVGRSGYQATSPAFGLNKQAVGTLTGGSLPTQTQSGEAIPMQDPVQILKAMSESKEKELSLDTLTEKEKEKILNSYTNCREIANRQYTSVIEPELLRRRAIYRATPEHYKAIFPQLSETSNWCSKDVQTTCEWLLSGLMEAFTGSDQPLSIKGVKIEDDEVADILQQLVRYQLERKNDYHSFCLSTLKFALSENFAVAKVWWKREEERRTMKMMLDLTDDELILGMLELETQGKIEIKKMKNIKDTDDFMEVTWDEVIVKSNHPVVEYIPSSELRYTPDAANLQECKFVAQRKLVRGDYLKRRELEGVYKDVDKAIEEFGTGNTKPTLLDKRNDPDRTEPTKFPSDSDNASKEVELYEAYLWVDYNDDGILENIIVHAVGDNLLRVVKNDFEFPPFFICSSVYDPNTVFNRESFADSFEQLQDLKTAVIRQIITNVAKNNAPRVFVSEQGVDMDALMAGDEIIPVQGDPSTKIVTPPSLPLSSLSMEIVNYAQSELESQSGSTRYNQGLDSNSLNKTATGVTAIMGASEKRNKVMARSIAERFFIPIYRFIILLNQKYLEDEQMVRLTNKNVNIRRDALNIDYDLIINVGQGAGTKEAQIQYLMLVLNQIYPQLSNIGIVNAKSWYNLVVKLLEALGLRDVTQYLMDPESPEAQQAAQQQQALQAQAQAEALQNSLQLSIAKSSVPRITVDITKLPPDVQKQYLEDKLGIETTEKEIAEHEVLRDND